MSSDRPEPAQGTPTVPTPERRREAGRPQSLAVRISAGLVAFVTLVFCLYAVFTLSVAEQTIRDRIAEDLGATLHRAWVQLEHRGPTAGFSAPLSAMGAGTPLPTGAGLESGTLVTIAAEEGLSDHSGQSVDGYILDAVGGQRALTSKERRELIDGLADGPVEEATEVDFEGAAYMVQGKRLSPAVAAASGGRFLVVGVPIDSQLKVLNDSRVGILGSIAVVIIVVAIGSWAWVRRSLGPLADISASANAVSALPVGTPGVHLADYRVPESASRRKDEMAVVASAFNHMLTSMDESLDERQHLEDKLRRFVADASHELRTPLASIRGYSEMIGFTEPLSERGRESLNRVLAQSDRMTRLVDDLLFLARMDREEQRRLASGGPGDTERRLVSVAELAVDAVADARAAAPDHEWDVEISEEKLSQGPRVCGDLHQLERVVGNLLSNARKHTPAGTTVWVYVDVVPFPEAPSGRGVRLVVQDDGPGVPEQIMPVLFDRFIRASAAREPVEGSTGLGLAIVRAVVEAHGGTITADSEPGRTRMVVTLPAVDDDGPLRG